MSIKQISAFVENKPGSVYKLLQALTDAGINLRAINIADTQDFGVLRLIAEDNAKAKEALGEDTLFVVTEVIDVEMIEKVGSLCSITKVLSEADINIEYLYSFTRPTKLGTYAVIRVDDVPAAEKALAANGIRLMSEEEIA